LIKLLILLWKLGGLWAVFIIVTVLHFFLAILDTSEVADYPLFNLKQKIMWPLILWLLPVIGTLLVHKKLNLGWRARSGTKGDVTTGGYGSEGRGGSDGGGSGGD